MVVRRTTTGPDTQVTRCALDAMGPAARELSVADWKARLDSPGVRRRSDYPAILRDWGTHFAPERIFLAFFEEVSAAPRELLVRLCEFLGVAPPDPGWLREARVAEPASPTPGTGIPMPPEIRRHLAVEYAGVLEELHLRFGGPASRWYRTARAGEAVPPPEAGRPAAGVESTHLGCARSGSSSS